MTPPCIALLGFSIECNRFAPVATQQDFEARTLMGGPAMLTNARLPAPSMLGELPGFIADMDAAGAWEPMPSLLAMAEPNGPVDAGFFQRLMENWERDLTQCGALDGIYCVLHGAGLTTEDDDPEGTLLAMIRRVRGNDIPVVASYDLHANVSAANVELVNAFIGYRTNPHLDMRARGAESAQIMRRLIGGTKTFLAYVRLPIVPPTVTMLTGSDAPNRPYGELIDLGQRRMRDAPYAGRVLNACSCSRSTSDSPGAPGREGTSRTLRGDRARMPASIVACNYGYKQRRRPCLPRGPDVPTVLFHSPASAPRLPC